MAKKIKPTDTTQERSTDESPDATTPGTDSIPVTDADEAPGATSSKDEAAADGDAPQVVDAETPAESDDTAEPETPTTETAGEAGGATADTEAEAGVAADQPDRDEQSDTADNAQETTQAVPPGDTHRPETVPQEVVVQRRGGFVPMVLGGVVAAGIGAGAVLALFPQGWQGAGPELQSAVATLESQMSDQSGLIDVLTQRLDDLPPPPDTSGLSAAQKDIQQRLSDLGSRMDDLSAQVGELAARPAGGATTDADLSQIRQRLQDMQARLTTQQDKLSALDQAAAARQQATRGAVIRAAVERVQTALDTGQSFGPALTDLRDTGVTVPDALAQVAKTGVPTMDALRADFPDAARAALASVRKASGADRALGSVADFFKSQLGVRSLVPREGDDPDAVLSRAEAALRDGHLGDALAQLGKLPDVAKAPLSDWMASAKTRQDAVAAAKTLAANAS